MTNSKIQRMTATQAKVARGMWMTHQDKLTGPEAGGAGSDFLVGWGLFLFGIMTGGVGLILWAIWLVWVIFVRRDNRENTARLVRVQEQQLKAAHVQANRIAELEEKVRIAELEARLTQIKGEDQDLIEAGN